MGTRNYPHYYTALMSPVGPACVDHSVIWDVKLGAGHWLVTRTSYWMSAQLWDEAGCMALLLSKC